LELRQRRDVDHVFVAVDHLCLDVKVPLKHLASPPVGRAGVVQPFKRRSNLEKLEDAFDLAAATNTYTQKIRPLRLPLRK
jgi:hypothetical protein